MLLGDVLDVQSVRLGGEVGSGPVDRWATVVPRIERIAAGHPSVFDALGRWVAAGLGLDLVAGNHDLELVEAPSRRRLAALIAEAGGHPEAAAEVVVHPWILHVPGLLYAEHGQQHHDVNRSTGLLEAEAGGVPLPPARHLDDLMLDLADAVAPDAPPDMPPPRATARALRAHPTRARAAWRPVVRATAGLAASTRALRTAGRPEARARHEAHVRAHAGRVGVSEEALVALDRLSATSPSAIAWRLARLTARSLGPSRPAAPPYMVAAARAVHRELAAGGQDVPFYVFGHTHVADDRPLMRAPGAPRYLNPGTWSTFVEPGQEERTRGFVEITRDGEDDRPAARLLRWEASTGERRPL